MKIILYIFIILFAKVSLGQKQADTIQAHYAGGVNQLATFLKKSLKSMKDFPDSKDPSLSGKMIITRIILDNKNKVNKIDYANLQNHYQGNSIDIIFKNELQEVLKKSNKWQSKSFKEKCYHSKIIYIFKFWNDSIDITPYPLKYEEDYFSYNETVIMEKENSYNEIVEIVPQHDGVKGEGGIVLEDTKQEVFTIVEEMPEFIGGREKLDKFINETISYPKQAKKNKLTGNTYCSFIVNTEGGISDIEVIKSSKHEILDKEAIRIIKAMPKWKPGQQNGRKVPVIIIMPIRFTFNDEK